MSDRQWRKGLSKAGRTPTPAVPPQQVVFDTDGRLADDRDPNPHTHGSIDITDGAATFVTVAQFQTWLEQLAERSLALHLDIPQFPPA